MIASKRARRKHEISLIIEKVVQREGEGDNNRIWGSWNILQEP